MFQTYLISTNQITYEYTRVTAIDENSDYERSLESGQLKTWPWYFRALVVGEFICEGEERKILINHRGKVIPFSHGIYKNWIHFAKLSWKGLSLPNRGWQNRWNRSGIVMESFIMENRSKIKFHETNCEPDNHHIQEDGYVSRLFIEEVGNVSISKSLIQQLEKEFGK